MGENKRIINSHDNYELIRVTKAEIYKLISENVKDLSVFNCGIKTKIN